MKRSEDTPGPRESRSKAKEVRLGGQIRELFMTRKGPTFDSKW